MTWEAGPGNLTSPFCFFGCSFSCIILTTFRNLHFEYKNRTALRARWFSREFKKRRRRRREQSRLKNELIFCLRISRYYEVIWFVKTISKLNMEHSVTLEIAIQKKISRRRSRSQGNAKFGLFTLMFRRGLKEMYKDL